MRSEREPRGKHRLQQANRKRELGKHHRENRSGDQTLDSSQRFNKDRDPQGEQKYSPPVVVDTISKPLIGTPDLEEYARQSLRDRISA